MMPKGVCLRSLYLRVARPKMEGVRILTPGDLLIDGLAVLVGQLHLAHHHAGEVALGLGLDEDESGAHALELLGDGVLQPLDDRDHGDHRGNADDDAERRQDRAHQVGAERPEGDAEIFQEDHGRPFRRAARRPAARSPPASRRAPSAGRR